METNCKFFHLVLAFALLVLIGCSESEPNHSEPEYSEELLSAENLEDEYADRLDQYPAGWRPGVILMKLYIHQNADVHEENSSQGGLKSHAKWAYTLNAAQTIAVMLPPDFTKLLPDYSAKKINAEQLNEDAYIETADTPLETKSLVTMKGFFEVHTPNASDYTYMLTEQDASGPLIDFELKHIRPSRIGKGFEAAINLDYKLKGTYTISSRIGNGALHKLDQECCSREPRTLQFFPVPDPSLQGRVEPADDESIPPEIAEYNQQLQRDFFTSLYKISAGQDVRATLHPDMTWKAEPNQLTLRYHSESEHLLAEGGQFSMAAPAGERHFTLEIILKAEN